jgi:hypothetical protein
MKWKRSRKAQQESKNKDNHHSNSNSSSSSGSSNNNSNNEEKSSRSSSSSALSTSAQNQNSTTAIRNGINNEKVMTNLTNNTNFHFAKNIDPHITQHALLHSSSSHQRVALNTNGKEVLPPNDESYSNNLIGRVQPSVFSEDVWRIV